MLQLEVQHASAQAQALQAQAATHDDAVTELRELSKAKHGEAIARHDQLTVALREDHIAATVEQRSQHELGLATLGGEWEARAAAFNSTWKAELVESDAAGRGALSAAIEKHERVLGGHLASAEAALVELRADHAEEILELRQKQRAAMQRQMDAHTLTVAALNEKFAARHSECESTVAVTNSTWRAALSAAAEGYERALAARAAVSEAALANLSAAHVVRTVALEKQQQVVGAALAAAQSLALAEVEGQSATKLSEVKAQHERVLTALRNENSHALEEQRSQLDSKHVVDLKAATDAGAVQRAEAMAVTNAENAVKLAASLAGLEAAHEEETETTLSELRKSHTVELSVAAEAAAQTHDANVTVVKVELEAKHAAERAALQEAAGATAAGATAENDGASVRALALHEGKLDALKAAHQEEIETTLSELRKSHAAMLSVAAEAAAQVHEANVTNVKMEMQAKHGAALAVTTRERLAELSKVREKHATEMLAATEDSARSQAAAIAELKLEHSASVAAVRSEWEVKIAATSSEQQQQQQERLAAWESKLSTANVARERLEALEMAHKEEIEAALLQLREKLALEMSVTAAATAQVHDATVANVKVELGSRHAEVLAAARRDADTRATAVTAEARKDAGRAVVQHEERLQALKVVHQHELEAALSELRGRHAVEASSSMAASAEQHATAIAKLRLEHNASIAAVHLEWEVKDAVSSQQMQDQQGRLATLDVKLATSESAGREAVAAVVSEHELALVAQVVVHDERLQAAMQSAVELAKVHDRAASKLEAEAAATVLGLNAANALALAGLKAGHERQLTALKAEQRAQEEAAAAVDTLGRACRSQLAAFTELRAATDTEATAAVRNLSARHVEALEGLEQAYAARLQAALQQANVAAEAEAASVAAEEVARNESDLQALRLAHSEALEKALAESLGHLAQLRSAHTAELSAAADAAAQAHKANVTSVRVELEARHAADLAAAQEGAEVAQHAALVELAAALAGVVEVPAEFFAGSALVGWQVAAVVTLLAVATVCGMLVSRARATSSSVQPALERPTMVVASTMAREPPAFADAGSMTEEAAADGLADAGGDTTIFACCLRVAGYQTCEHPDEPEEQIHGIIRPGQLYKVEEMARVGGGKTRLRLQLEAESRGCSALTAWVSLHAHTGDQLFDLVSLHPECHELVHGERPSGGGGVPEGQNLV